MQYTDNDMEELLVQLNLLIVDVQSLTEQLKMAQVLNEQLIAQNCVMAMSLESVGIQAVNPSTLH